MEKIAMGRKTKISGPLLRTLRQEAGYTQEALGKRVGISRETVSAIENEKPGSLNSIGAEVISMWYILCRQGATDHTQNRFFAHMMKYFGFSEKTLINTAKSLAHDHKQD